MNWNGFYINKNILSTLDVGCDRYTIAAGINCKGPKTIYVRVVLIRGIEK